MVLKFETRKIIINLPAELLARIDEAAKLEWTSRTDYIRRVMTKELQEKSVEELRQAQIDKMNGIGY